MIPWELRNDPFVQYAARGGFGINSKANGVLLGTKVHLGSHPKYTAAIQSKIDRLAAQGLTAEQAALELESYAARLQAGLIRTTAKIH
jgi:hypothetical protein